MSLVGKNDEIKEALNEADTAYGKLISRNEDYRKEVGAKFIISNNDLLNITLEL